MPSQGISGKLFVLDRLGCVLGVLFGWCVFRRFVLGSLFVRCVSGSRACVLSLVEIVCERFLHA